jgi:hypothetical protein
MTNTRVIVLNTSVVSKASEIEQLVVLSFLKDMNNCMLTIEQARKEITAILSPYADGQDLFISTSFSNN